ncbi:MAG: TIGR03545 family protein [Epsilonproteobacteria bacterium]|nr:TIGR03545 family protein [Campylobacterota bacterium]
MGFFIKLLKELNSAESEKFIVLALALGLISGFLPMFNVVNIIILFIVFTLRVPLGLYLSAWGVFGIVGYFMDYIFHKTGLMLLQAHILQPLWTWLYNLPLLRWSGFNNSIVLGSLVWGGILAIVLYITVSKIIPIYREKAFAFFNSISYLKWIVPKEQKRGIIRWSGLAGIGAIFALVIAFFVTFTNPTIKFILEYSLSKALHQDVYIKSVDVSFKNAHLTIHKLQTPKFTIDNILVDLSWKYLIWRKFDIEKLIISNINIQKSVLQLVKHSSNSTGTHKFDLHLNLPSPAKLLQNPLTVTQKIAKLKKDYKQLQTLISNIKSDIKNQKNNIKSIQADIQKLQHIQIKNTNDINKILSIVNSLKSKINAINTRLSQDKQNILKAKKILLADTKQIKIALKHDYRTLSQQYNLIQNHQYLQATNMLLKPQISYYVDKFHTIYDHIKPYLSHLHTQPQPQYIRKQGITIKFPDHIKYPDFLLSYGKANAILDDATFKIEAFNLTDNQSLTNKPAKLQINSTSKYYKALHIQASYLHNKLVADTSLEGFHVDKLTKDNLTIIQPIISSHITLAYDHHLKATAKIYIQAKEVRFQKYTLNNIKDFNIDVHIDKDIQISSDLDKILTKFISQQLAQQINAKKAQLKTMLDKKVAKELQGINPSEVDQILKSITTQQSSIDSLKELLKKYSKSYLSKQLLKSNLFKF